MRVEWERMAWLMCRADSGEEAVEDRAERHVKRGTHSGAGGALPIGGREVQCGRFAW